MFPFELPQIGAVMNKISYSSVAVSLAVAPMAVAATAVLYDQDFENPFNFSNDGADVNISSSVNENYGNQPAGFAIASNNTTETLNVTGSNRGTGSAAFGTGWSDPSNTAGDFAIGMLSDVQNDILGLSFDAGSNAFLNVGLDLSSIDLSDFGGPYVPANAEPVLQLSLFDNPGGGVSLTGNGILLDQQTLTGTASAGDVFDWTNGVLGLSTAGNTDGNVTLQADLLAGGYAAIDNIKVVASNQPGQLNVVPLPSSAWMLIAGFGMIGGIHRMRKAKS